ncbi:alcohol dehydrogenase catalytic domain-containing protein [Sorangium sp. So ce1036]
MDTIDTPVLEQATDAIVRVTSTALCGSDLHIYNGHFPQTRPLVLGHEFMGIVEEVGSDVRKLRPGNRVVVPFAVACGSCFFCERNLPGHCERSNPGHYGPEGNVISSKGVGSSGIPTSTAGTLVVRRSTSAFRTRIRARARWVPS